MATGFQWYPGQRERLRRAFSAALEDTAQDILDDINASGTIPHAPAARTGRRPGLLQESGSVEADRARGRVRIVYDVPFARSVYFHPRWHFSTAVNPRPQGLWFQPYLPGGEKVAFVHERYVRNLRKRKGLLS